MVEDSLKIGDIRDPNLFERLVHALFVADRGYAFEVVDDSGGDKGNDGYDPERGILYCIYCPEKLGTDAKYLTKLNRDLLKAQKLRTQRGYDFSSWTVVTPFPLREPVHTSLRAKAEESGISVSFMADSHLVDLYLRHPHLHDQFPDLQYPQVEAALRDVEKALRNMKSSEAQTAPPPSDPSRATAALTSLLAQGFASPVLVAIFERLEAGDMSALHDLERYRLEAPNQRERLAALLLEVEFERDRLNFPAIQLAAARGLEIAMLLNLPSEKALFASYLAFAETMKYVEAHISYAATVRMWRQTGFLITSVEDFTQAAQQLTETRNQIAARLNAAYSDARASDDLVVLYTVLLHRASCATQMAFPIRLLIEDGETSLMPALDELKAQMERSYETAIPAAKALDDQYRLATAYSNYANDLLAFGDKDRALSHAQHAFALAEALKDDRQIKKTKQLLNKLQPSTH